VTQLKLQLDWKPNAQFAGILLAHYQGWYEQAGLELVINPWQSHTNPVDALDSHENVVVSTEDNLLIRARVAGKAVKAIGTMMQYSGIGWTALRASGIKNMADLKGKRIGIHGDGETALNIALAHFGMTRHEVEIVEVGFDYADLLRRGEFAAVQCFVVVEPLELERMGFELVVLPAYKWGYEVYGQVLATSDRLLAAETAALTRFLKVTFAGWRQALETPQETAYLIATHYLPETKADLEADILRGLRPFLAGKVGIEKMGWMDSDRWAQSIGYLVEHGLIAAAPAPAAIMTNALIEAIYQP
jgi:ABC-type nitrate/sulfonate/bicarbonate transport system substrate-binding protein